MNNLRWNIREHLHLLIYFYPNAESENSHSTGRGFKYGDHLLWGGTHTRNAMAHVPRSLKQTNIKNCSGPSDKCIKDTALVG